MKKLDKVKDTIYLKKVALDFRELHLDFYSQSQDCLASMGIFTGKNRQERLPPTLRRVWVLPLLQIHFILSRP